jgi:site-specific DNA recombinase
VITNDLNARGIPSPGARWNRSERRRDGRWLISALHAMLQSERYAGRLVWNRSVGVKDPDTGKRVRRERPVVRNDPTRQRTCQRLLQGKGAVA